MDGLVKSALIVEDEDDFASDGTMCDGSEEFANAEDEGQIWTL